MPIVGQGQSQLTKNFKPCPGVLTLSVVEADKRVVDPLRFWPSPYDRLIDLPYRFVLKLLAELAGGLCRLCKEQDAARGPIQTVGRKHPLPKMITHDLQHGVFAS